MATDLEHGRNGKVVVVVGEVETTIVHLNKWGADGFKRETTEVVEFGQDEKEYLVGLIDYGSITMSGYFDPTGSGQSDLLEMFNDGTTVTTIRFYYNTTDYMEPDTAANPDSGFLVTSYGPIDVDASGVPTVSFTLKITGAMKFTSA